MTYTEWIAAFVAKHDGKVLGRCQPAAVEMRAVFPELRIVQGHVLDAVWGKRGHWWLVDPAGSIIDPTVSQFPAPVEYIGWTPDEPVRIGKCMECGEEIWETVPSLTDTRMKRFCDGNCERAFASSLMEHT